MTEPAEILETIDIEQTETFLEHLDSNATRWTFQTFDDSKQKRGYLVKLMHGTLDEWRDTLIELNQNGAGIYVTVNETNLAGRTESDVIRVRAAFIDLDGAPLEPIDHHPLERHIVVNSSPGRWHAYWLLKKCPLEQFRWLQKGLINQFNSDPQVCDLPRVMRLPGFFNMKKPQAPALVRIHDISPVIEPYTFQELIDAFRIPADTEPKATPASKGFATTIDPQELPILRSALGMIEPNRCGRQERVMIGMSLHDASHGSDQGLALWENWLSEADSHNLKEARHNWSTFKPKENGYTLGTLYNMAQQRGWIHPKAQAKNHTTDTPNDSESDITINPWPAFRDRALYGITGEVVRLAVKDCEADPAAVLMTFLASVSALIGNKPRVMIGETAHPPRIWSLIVGASSRARKGTSSKPVNRITRSIEERLGFDRVLRKSGPLSTGEGLVYEVRDRVEKEGPDGDIKVIDEGVTDKRLLVIDGEFGGALKAMQREGNTLSTTMREAWDIASPTDVISPMTKGNRCAATNPHIVVVGHITHKELAKLLSESDTYNGFGNRFLWCCARRSKSVPFPQPMDDTAVIDLTQRLTDVIRKARNRDEVSFSPETANAWRQVYEELTTDRPGVWGVITARAEAQVIRLALLYALLDGAHQIEMAHIGAALAVNRYCDYSARYIFGDAEPDGNANKLLEALRHGEKTTTELIKVFDNHISKSRLRSLLDHLQSAGRITYHREKTKGRPKDTWQLVDGFQLPNVYNDNCELS